MAAKFYIQPRDVVRLRLLRTTLGFIFIISLLSIMSFCIIFVRFIVCFIVRVAFVRIKLMMMMTMMTMCHFKLYTQLVVFVLLPLWGNIIRTANSLLEVKI